MRRWQLLALSGALSLLATGLVRIGQKSDNYQPRVLNLRLIIPYRAKFYP